MEIALFIVYGTALLFILCYSVIQIQLVIKYKKYKRLQKQRLKESSDQPNLPFVTVQLPLFNEQYVAARLVDSMAQLDYPKDKLEIQVLDDSTDETLDIVKKKVEEWKANGVDIVQICRTDRSGFKAGALAEGLKIAKGEFLAIFDADFLPNPDFLKRTLNEFTDDNIGMVQTRWEHINEDYSMLTKLQAFGLDAHFTVEQGGRNAGGHFMNFNGTAGVWRKKTIEDAGGWQSDTLTEDLDLSYRAQLKGWKFKFLEEVGAPAELPAEMNALKTQQFRWNKGAAECTRKNLGKVLRAPNLGLGTKLNAIFHLMNSAIFICIVLISILSIPALSVKFYNIEYKLLFQIASAFILCLPILAIFYWTSLTREEPNKVKAFFKFLFLFPLFLSVSMGLSLHNALAVLEGYIGKKTPFVRTPKMNLTNDSKNTWAKNVYLKGHLTPLTFVELAFAAYFLFGISLAFKYEDFGLMPFHVLLAFGFVYVALYSLIHSFKISRS